MYNFKTKTIIDTDYHEIENIINAHYYVEGLHKEKYELPPTEERGSGNGESWEVSLKKEPIREYYMKDLEEVKLGKWPSFCTRILLQDLCNKECIPEGTYIIDISW